MGSTEPEPSAAGVHPGARAAPPTENPPMFSPAQRRLALGYSAAVGVVAVAASAVFVDADTYVAAWVLAAGPYTTPALVLSWLAIGRAPAVHRPFWVGWFTGLVVAYVAGALLVASVVFDQTWLLVCATALIAIALPIWGWASLLMLRSKSGRRAVSVDIADSAIALVVLTAPGAYFFVEPLLRASDVWVAIPFAAAVAMTPAGIYLALVNFARIPRGQRETQGIAVTMAAVASVNIAMQVAQILRDFTLPIPPLIALQSINMALLMALPLWAHRGAPEGLDRLAPEHQVRRNNPMPYIGAVILPALAVYALANRDEQPWGPAFVIAVLLTVALLNAVRYTLMQRETHRLYAELSAVAQQRKELVANMVRALEDDRHRMAAELHEQAVESFTTLGTLIQTAYVTLPPDTALAVKEAIAHIQDDLSTRVESLRRLMVAIQPPVLEEGGLVSALRAYAAELYGDRSGTLVHVEVDPELVLDWSTKTIVYRISQEALDNTWRHAMAPTVRVGAREEAGTVVVTVADDGVGFDPSATEEGTGFATMRLFAELGRGTFAVHSIAGEGTTVRACLGVAEGEPFDAFEPPPASSRPTLHLVVDDDVSVAAER